jgi:hypothetical protein
LSGSARDFAYAKQRVQIVDFAYAVLAGATKKIPLQSH